MLESSRQMDEGVRLYSSGNLDGAITALRLSVAAWPKNSLAYFNLGLVLADKGDLGAAATAYEQAIALMEASGGAPARNTVLSLTLAEALNNLALVYYQQNRMDDAALRIKDCIGRIPDHADCLVTNGVLLRRRESWMTRSSHTERRTR